MNKLWFRRKTYGWGWYPATWQGWGIVTLYVAILIFLGSKVQSYGNTSELLSRFFVPIIILTALLLFITYKTGETPKWQWGKKNDDTK